MSEAQPQETSTQGKYLFSSFPLYEHKTPEFREAKGYEYIRYGQDNTYPDYLVYLYNRSSIHGAIVNGKKRFILGHGWKMKNNATDMNMARFLRNPNSFDTLDEVTDKCILDRMIFGGYALRVVWFGGRITNVYHQPFQTIRVGAEGNIYYVSNEWTRDMSTKANFKSNGKIPTDAVSYEPFNPNRKEGTQILYVTDYRPQVNIYPLPEYVSCNASIETDVEISNFHLNNIKTGFAAGTMVTFFNGKPSEEDAKQHERDLKAKAGGTDNGGQIILNYAEVNETKPEILPLRSNELDKQYLQLEESVTQNIFIGHGVTSPMLFGLKTEGQLGGRNELDMAWNLFSLNYVEPKRRQFESEFNYVLTVGGYAAQIELQPLKGLGIEITESLLTANLTKDELRGLIAESLSITLKPLTEPTAPITTEMDGQKMDFDNILINAFSKIGISSEGLEFVVDITEDEKKVLDYIKGKKEIDIKQASKDLKLDVEKIMRSLIEKNVIAGKTTKGMVEIEKIQLPPEPDKSESSSYEIVTMYKYDWVDPSQAVDIDNSRSFCKRLLGLNKLYTREEIDGLNNDMKDFNKDVWKYRGGWMTVPNTDGLLHTPFCRHTWKQVLIKKKK